MTQFNCNEIENLQKESHNCCLAKENIIVEIDRGKSRSLVEDQIQDTLAKCDIIRRKINDIIKTVEILNLTNECLMKIAEVLIKMRVAEKVADQYSKKQDKQLIWENNLKRTSTIDIYNKVIFPILSGDDPF